MLIRAFVPRYNSHGRVDVSGAFLPEAHAFLKLHGVAPKPPSLVSFDNQEREGVRAKAVLATLASCDPHEPLDCVAFFCHGWDGPRTGIQAGFRVQNAKVLAAAIAAVSKPSVVVPLYCCEVGSDADRDKEDDTAPGPAGDGGFADVLRDELCAAGCVDAKVLGHVTTAHTTRNAFTRIFAGNGTREAKSGGDWLIEPSHELWPKWRAALKGDLRLRFPFMSREEIEAELRG